MWRRFATFGLQKAKYLCPYKSRKVLSQALQFQTLTAQSPVGYVKHRLLRNADAPAPGGDLALLHARDQNRCEACVADVRELALPPDVLVAGREVHPRRGCQT